MSIVIKMGAFFSSQGAIREREQSSCSPTTCRRSRDPPEHVLPAIETILADNRAAIAEILKTQGQNPTWAGLILAMDELNDRLGAAWSRSATSTPCATAPNCAKLRVVPASPERLLHRDGPEPRAVPGL